MRITWVYEKLYFYFLKTKCLIFISIIWKVPIIAGQFYKPPKRPGERAGSCPPPSPLTICDAQCNEDTDCAVPDEKCCPTACEGRACIPGVTETVIRSKSFNYWKNDISQYIE